MNSFCVTFRSLVIATVVLSSFQIKGMNLGVSNTWIEAQSKKERASSTIINSKDAVVFAASLAGYPNYGLSMLSAVGTSVENMFFKNEIFKKEDKRIFVANAVAYAFFDAAKRYGLDMAVSYVGVPHYMTERFNGLSSGIQAALKFLGSYFGQKFHDNTTRMTLSALNDWYFTPKQSL